MICYGRMFDDADVGHFTFTESEKGCSLIHYAIVTPNLANIRF